MLLSNLLLLLLALISLIHLRDCYNDNNRRFITKPLLLPLILSYYIFSLEDMSVASKPLITALVCSWIGDCLLIPRGKFWLFFGGSFFSMAHFSLIFMCDSEVKVQELNLHVLIPCIIIYITISLNIITDSLPTAPKFMQLPLLLYLLLNSCTNLFFLVGFLASDA